MQFSAIKNLECLSHELKKDFTALEPFEKDMLIVFEKIDLIEETTLGTYIIESFWFLHEKENPEIYNTQKDNN